MMSGVARTYIVAKVLDRIVDELYASTWIGFLQNFAAIAFILLLSRGKIPVSYILPWGAVFFAVFAVRLGIVHWRRMCRPQYPVTFWRIVFQAGLFLTAIIWSAIPWILFRHGDTQTAFLLTGILVAVPLTVAFGLLIDLTACMIFPVLIYSSLALWWRDTGAQGQQVALAFLLLIPLVFSLARRANQVAAANIRQEIALAEARDAADAANHAKSEFLASMSHELRTPLNAVIGFSQVIAEGHFGPVYPARYKDYADDILAAGHHLLSLINDILDLSKLEAGRLQLDETIVNTADMVDGVVHMMQATARKTAIEIEAELPDDLPDMLLDERAVRQIILNLLSNAIKFSPEKSKILVRAVYTGVGGLRVEIQDSGPGMPELDVKKAFEPFSSISSVGKNRGIQGTGLGLAISKSLAELHGGSLTLETAPGMGVKAVLSLPPSRLVPDQARLTA
ncbi:MAG: HAMP domain-containing sensor histidine kinase [Alphaproteobacteria bacterium]